MPIGIRVVSISRLILVVLLSHGALGIAYAADPLLPRDTILHHELFVQIVPEEHALAARDRLTLEVPQPKASIRFSLARTLQINHIALVHRSTGVEDAISDVPFELKYGAAPESAQEVSIPSEAVEAGLVTLDVYYHGVINDPPRDARHLRFVTPSETAGHIGPEGVYVSSESHWYPDISESLSTYAVVVGVPRGSLVLEGLGLATFTDVGESGLPVLRRFCPKCGSPVFSEAAATPNLDWLKAGTLDDTSWLWVIRFMFARARLGKGTSRRDRQTGHGGENQSHRRGSL